MFKLSFAYKHPATTKKTMVKLCKLCFVPFSEIAILLRKKQLQNSMILFLICDNKTSLLLKRSEKVH